MPEHGSARLPLYAQVEDVLVARITSGALPVGTQLPSEEELIREFGVSRTTIRMTIQNLVRQGLVDIRRGRGTFVASPRMVQELTGLTGFAEDMRVLGRTPSARVLSREIVAAPPHRRREARAVGWSNCGADPACSPLRRRATVF
jgi:GntR family transcriptional regulator